MTLFSFFSFSFFQGMTSAAVGENIENTLIVIDSEDMVNMQSACSHSWSEGTRYFCCSCCAFEHRDHH